MQKEALQSTMYSSKAELSLNSQLKEQVGGFKALEEAAKAEANKLKSLAALCAQVILKDHVQVYEREEALERDLATAKERTSRPSRRSCQSWRRWRCLHLLRPSAYSCPEGSQGEEERGRRGQKVRHPGKQALGLGRRRDRRRRGQGPCTCCPCTR